MHKNNNIQRYTTPKSTSTYDKKVALKRRKKANYHWKY